VPVIAHPSLFRPNFVIKPYLRKVGIMQGDEREKIETSGGEFFLSADPLTIMPGLMTTGEVERSKKYEHIGEDFFTIEKGRVHNDLMLDDISLVANVKQQGLVVITGCAHAGIVNIVKQAMRLTNVKKIEGIIGGFHLINASKTEIKSTVEELRKVNPRWVIAGHCTGFKAQVELYNTFNERFFPLHTGMTLESPGGIHGSFYTPSVRWNSMT